MARCSSHPAASRCRHLVNENDRAKSVLVVKLLVSLIMSVWGSLTIGIRLVRDSVYSACLLVSLSVCPSVRPSVCRLIQWRKVSNKHKFAGNVSFISPSRAIWRSFRLSSDRARFYRSFWKRSFSSGQLGLETKKHNSWANVWTADRVVKQNKH